MSASDLASLRRDFISDGLFESEMPDDPLDQFSKWFDEALASGIIDPNAMTVATVGDDGRPSVRIVLLKEYSRGGFVFFTNYESKKGTDLSAHPQCALHFFWPQFNRQIAIYGSASKVSHDESEEYFLSRPAGSRLSAWASKQSSVVASREELESRVEQLKQEFGDDIPLPPFWGGFRVIPDKFEFWQGRQNRLHDRIVYLREHDEWTLERLAP